MVTADHLDFARKIAQWYARRCPIDRDDLIAAGMLGLVEAAGRYDVAAGHEFLAFAAHRIHGAIRDELRRGDPLTRRERQRARATDGPIVATVQVAKPTPSPEDEVAAREEARRLLGAVSRLGEREQAVLAVIYSNEEITGRRLGKWLGVSSSRVTQIRKRALAKLRAMLGVESGAA